MIQDFRERMEDNRQGAARARSAIGLLGGACSVMAVLVLAGGLVMFGNYRKMKDMEAVIASVMPSDGKSGAFRSFAGADGSDEVEVEAVPGEVYPTLADIVISPEQGSGTESSVPAGTEGGKAGNTQTEAGVPAGGAGAESQEKAGTLHGGNAGASADALSGETERGPVVKESGNHADDPAAKEAGAGAAAQTPVQGAKTGVAAQAAASVQIPADAVKHVVQEGETLYGICMEQYHSMAQIPQICAWNGLADENHISVGQELYLPAK